MSFDTDVVVIGAGAAGLAAAGVLARSGVRVRVLEARGRVGGRIDTRHVRGFRAPLEMGAELVHGDAPAVEELVRASRTHAIDLRTGHAVVQGGALVGDDDGPSWGRALAFVGSPERRDVALSVELDALDDARAREIATAYVEGFDAAHVERVSARWISDIERASADEHPERGRRVVEGYATILEALDVPREAIELDAVVERIAWRSRSREGVTCASRSKSGFARADVHARAALLTLPVGVLEAGAVHFEPELPPAKRAAIAAMATGPIHKAHLRFRSAFWTSAGTAAEFARAEGELPGYLHAWGVPWPTWWPNEEASMLTGWAAARAADALGAVSTEERVARAIASLATILGIPRARIESELEAWELVDWQADPFARGGYAYVRAGGLAAARGLADAIDARLFFAGEATSAHAGTVHGAIESGRRAAREVLDALSL